MLVVTVKTTPLLTVKIPLVAEVLLNVTELMDVLTVTVTLSPGLITTSSVVLGTAPPNQVPPAFQLPLPLLVIIALYASIDPANKKAIANKKRAYRVFDVFFKPKALVKLFALKQSIGRLKNSLKNVKTSVLKV